MPDNVTAPGTELKLGESAVAVYDGYPQINNVEVTVVSITKGTQEDLSDYDIKDAALRLATPYYVVARYTNIGGEVMEYPSFEYDLKALNQEGLTVSSVYVSSKFEKCKREYVDELTVGESYENCKVFMAPPGSDVVAASWRPTYTDDPFIWRA